MQIHISPVFSLFTTPLLALSPNSSSSIIRKIPLFHLFREDLSSFQFSNRLKVSGVLKTSFQANRENLYVSGQTKGYSTINANWNASVQKPTVTLNCSID
jgi:hypothetical protein